jgi:hypothetical protein
MHHSPAELDLILDAANSGAYDGLPKGKRTIILTQDKSEVVLSVPKADGSGRDVYVRKNEKWSDMQPVPSGGDYSTKP